MYKLLAFIVIGLMLYIFLSSFVIMSGVKILGLIVFGLAAGLCIGSFKKRS